VVTAAAVIGLNVQYGIGVAIAASIIDHLRHSYRPRSYVLVKSAAGHWMPAPVEPGARTVPGLVVYRFGTSLYFANASQFVEDVVALTRRGGPLRWLVLDGAAIGDVDYTASAVLSRTIRELHQAHIKVMMTSVVDPVRDQLRHYGISGDNGPDGFYDTPGEALAAFHAAPG
jgi:SulP family sulfate permease